MAVVQDTPVAEAIAESVENVETADTQEEAPVAEEPATEENTEDQNIVHVAPPVYYTIPTLLVSTAPTEHKIHSTTFKWNGVDYPSLEAVTAALQETPHVVPVEPPAEEAKEEEVEFQAVLAPPPPVEEEVKETDAEVVKTRAVAPKKKGCCV